MSKRASRKSRTSRKSTKPQPPAQLPAGSDLPPADQPITEHVAAARLQMSRAWLQLKRVTGGGPKFWRTSTGMIRYIKRDIESYLSASLTSFESTSQYPPAL